MDQSKLPQYNIKTYKKFFDVKHNEKMWEVFFDHFDNSHKILDFGCGAAISIYSGRKRGYDIVGLDTKKSDRFFEFREALGVSKYVKLYKGDGRLPFDNDTFSLIVCRASFNKFNRRPGDIPENIPKAIERLHEFDRITTNEKIVVLTGSYFKKQFQQFDFKVYYWSKHRITKLWNH